MKELAGNGAAATAVRRLRELTGQSASGLAELVCVSPSTITRIERGEVCPSYDDMLAYARRAGYLIAGSEFARPEHLRGYKSAKEIGDFLNEELSAGLDGARLSTILRVLPKLVLDWRKLPYEDARAMAYARPSVAQEEWQALLEAAVRFFWHTAYWEEAPAWTRRTKLKRRFVPRGATRALGNKHFDKICSKCIPEFAEKNILFSRDEMYVI
jgi:transcriptional regulator with XRE-family HTH domain